MNENIAEMIHASGKPFWTQNSPHSTDVYEKLAKNERKILPWPTTSDSDILTLFQMFLN